MPIHTALLMFATLAMLMPYFRKLAAIHGKDEAFVGWPMNPQGEQHARGSVGSSESAVIRIDA